MASDVSTTGAWATSQPSQRSHGNVAACSATLHPACGTVRRPTHSTARATAQEPVSPSGDEMHRHVAGGEGLPHAVRQALLGARQLWQVEKGGDLAHVQ